MLRVTAPTDRPASRAAVRGSRRVAIQSRSDTHIAADSRARATAADGLGLPDTAGASTARLATTAAIRPIRKGPLW